MALKHKEHELQVAVAKYLAMRWPKALFLSDVRAAVKLTIPQQVRLKQVQKPGFKMPDMVIFEARHNYSAMFLELKAESPFKKDGRLKSDEHLQAQANALLALSQCGYHAQFYWDFDTIRTEIDWYLNG